MVFHRDLRLYLWTFKCLGILCVSYDDKQNKLYVKQLDRIMAVVLLTIKLIISNCILLYCIADTSAFHLLYYRSNKTGNTYQVFGFGFCCITFSVCNIYLYVNRCRHAHLVQKFLQLNRECLQQRCNKDFYRLYILYICLSVFSYYNYYNGYVRSDLTTPVLCCYVIMYGIHFTICGVFMFFYVCIRMVLGGTIEFYNQKLRDFASDIAVSNNCKQRITKQHDCIVSILLERSRLILLCQEKINRTYGFMLLIIAAYIIFIAPTGPFFLITVVFELKEEGVIAILFSTVRALLWDTSWLIAFIVLMSSNGIENEANKTSKILSNVPRTGTGIEKMIEKFLLKNLRPKPILTAYGFFSLDKSTLFKLFTAIFTYMVILVQFKEMESSTKYMSEKI